MDTGTNEVQALRKELDDFRNENIALYNELTNQNKTLCEQVIALREQLANVDRRLIYANSKFLPYHLTRLAGMQTAEWIVEHMNKLKAFDTREDHLKYALSQVPQNAVGGVILGVRRLRGQQYQSSFRHQARHDFLRLRQF